MDNNHVMLLRQRLQDRASRTPRLEPTPAGGPRDVDAAHTTTVRPCVTTSRWVKSEGTKRGRVGYLPARVDQRINLTLPDSRVFRVVYDSDDEGGMGTPADGAAGTVRLGGAFRLGGLVRPNESAAITTVRRGTPDGPHRGCRRSAETLRSSRRRRSLGDSVAGHRYLRLPTTDQHHLSGADRCC